MRRCSPPGSKTFTLLSRAMTEFIRLVCMMRVLAHDRQLGLKANGQWCPSQDQRPEEPTA
eukprot:12912173-Prorocentrum_lima.AAC.1